jgi:hypothetical protein
MRLPLSEETAGLPGFRSDKTYRIKLFRNLDPKCGAHL